MERNRGPGTEEREHAALLVDQFIRIVEERYGVSMAEITETVRIVRENKEHLSRLKHAGLVSLISVVVGASLLAAWEGIKAFLRGEGR